jgi:hypothetical protein
MAMARFYSVRYALGLFISNITRNLPFLLGLLWRERRLRLQLPRVAALSLLPSRRKEVLNILQRAMSQESWNRLCDIFVVPVLRLYGRFHVRRWALQERSRAYLDYLRRLVQPRRRAFSASE